ncbi:MAG: hypothetical protein FGM54_09925 [Chitinophagaceae bacterium]|nr:hypothetical protein [Chitinophagaceae bacterium]
MQKYVIGMVCLSIALLILSNCQTEPVRAESPYLNVADTTAHYVGMQTCRTCHEAVYQTYKETGMGKSWGLANSEKSTADFSPNKAHVYDDSLNMHYVPHWVDGKLYIEVGVKKIEPTGNFLTKDGFNWVDAKPTFDRLRSFLEKHSQVKYKINAMLFTHEPRFSVSRKSEILDRYQTSFDYCDSKYIEKDFTDKNTLTSASYFFERI